MCSYPYSVVTFTYSNLGLRGWITHQTFLNLWLKTLSITAIICVQYFTYVQLSLCNLITYECSRTRLKESMFPHGLLFYYCIYKHMFVSTYIFHLSRFLSGFPVSTVIVTWVCLLSSLLLCFIWLSYSSTDIIICQYIYDNYYFYF